MDKPNKLDRKSRFGQVREIHNQDKDSGEWIRLEDLAKKYNVSISSLSRVEHGADPSISILKAYSETFNVSLAYLLDVDESEDMKASSVIKELGLSDTSVTTLKEILSLSSKGYDLTAVVNAFLGNREFTVGFFQTLLTYLENDNNDMASSILFSSLKEYIEMVVKLKLRTVLEERKKMGEIIAAIPDEIKYTSEDN